MKITSLSWPKFFLEHPFILGVVIFSALVGGVLGWQLLPDDWSIWRQLAGGLVGGAGVGVLMTATKMLA